MTCAELGELLKLKDSYIKTHWNRVADSYERRGYRLYKVGRGDEAMYGIKVPCQAEIVWNVDELEMI